MTAKIRSLGNRELKQVLSLLERFSGDEFNYPVLERFKTLYMPFHLVNQLLPLGLKFLPGVYVATQEDKVLGLVWLSRDGHRKDRWKVEQIIIDPDYYASYDIGKQLLYYAINKFGAIGVETFLAYVDPHYSDGLALLKECGFRHCTKMHTFCMKPSADLLKSFQDIQIQGIREAEGNDARKLQELHSETLTPEARISLRKSPEDLYPRLAERLIQQCKGEFHKRWVVSPGSQDYLYGSLSISTTDYKNFAISVMAAPAWDNGTEDLIVFALEKIFKNSSTPNITVNSYEFQKSKMETLVKLGFEKLLTIEILVKDYWSPVKDQAIRAKSPVLLFAKKGGISPA